MARIFGTFCEMLQRLLHVHFQHVVDVLALEADLQRLAVEAPALADGARHPDVGEEIHLQPIGAVALARLAAAARLVEAEAARLVAANLRLGQLGEQSADLVEDLDVRRRVRARRAADRRLVDVDDLVDVLRAVDAIVLADRDALAVDGFFVLVSRRSSLLLRSAALPQALACRMSLTSELLPEPLTPVTQTNRPSGISTVMFLRLWWRAPTMRQHLAVAGAALSAERRSA